MTYVYVSETCTESPYIGNTVLPSGDSPFTPTGTTSSSKWTIIGICLGGGLLIILITIIVLCCCIKGKKEEKDAEIIVYTEPVKSKKKLLDDEIVLTDRH